MCQSTSLCGFQFGSVTAVLGIGLSFCCFRTAIPSPISPTCTNATDESLPSCDLNDPNSNTNCHGDWMWSWDDGNNNIATPSGNVLRPPQQHSSDGNGKFLNSQRYSNMAINVAHIPDGTSVCLSFMYASVDDDGQWNRPYIKIFSLYKSNIRTKMGSNGFDLARVTKMTNGIWEEYSIDICLNGIKEIRFQSDLKGRNALVGVANMRWTYSTKHCPAITTKSIERTTRTPSKTTRSTKTTSTTTRSTTPSTTTTSTTTTSTTTRSTTTHMPLVGECRDNNLFCTAYPESACSNHQWALRNCKLRCGLCSKLKCISGFLYYPPEDVCIRVFTERLSWMEAKQNCSDIGADLVIITTEMKNTFISGQIKDESWIGLINVAWVGAEFKWWNNSPLSSYHPWLDGQQPWNDKCVYTSYTGRWDGSNCDYDRRFVCEMTANK